MSSASHDHDTGPFARAQRAYARVIVGRPLAVIVVLLITFCVALWGTTKLTINSNQLDLIDQNLPEVKEVKRVIDIVGGAGNLIIGVRGADPALLRKVADDMNGVITADKEHVRYVTYRMPVEFIQKNMVLFINTEDLKEARKRINAYIADARRRANPFFIEIVPTPPVKLDLTDLINKYGHVGNKSIRDEYIASSKYKGSDPDNTDPDGHMVLVLVKPMWDSNDLGKTKDYIEQLRGDLAKYSATNKRGIKLEESYDTSVPPAGTITYGFTGTYKTAADDSFAIQESLAPVSIIAFVAIFLITIVFFRKLAPTLIVISGMVVGTIYAMGFAYLVFGELNMITSILGGILMGFGVDYGIQFVYRTRIELGSGKPYDVAITDSLMNAGRPASVAAVVTGGSFLVLLISNFRGFSQFGLLAGFGTIIIGFTLFCWSPAILSLIGRWKPEMVGKLIGITPPPSSMNEGGEIRLPHPKIILGFAVVIIAILCAFAIPWTTVDLKQDEVPTMLQRLKGGIRFNYNTRALLPEKVNSVELADELADKFSISSDPAAVYTKDLAGAKGLWDELSPKVKAGDPKYSEISQVLSVFSFVPPPDIAAANAKVLEEWQNDLKDVDVKALPPDLQKNAQFFMDVLAVRPFDVTKVPEIYQSQFKWLPSTKPENRGYLTYIYPTSDLRDGKKLLKFVDQIRLIQTATGTTFHGAGQAVLYAMLARTVLRDGYWTVILATIWILFMHYSDFRSVKLAAASVIPLGVGLVMTMGMMSMFNKQLNFMNIIILPILLGFGVSHGLYLLHRFLEGTSPMVALRSVGAAVASSTLTAIAGFGALFFAAHNGLKSMGFVACLGLTTTLIVSFTVLAAVLELIYQGQKNREAADKGVKEKAA